MQKYIDNKERPEARVCVIFPPSITQAECQEECVKRIEKEYADKTTEMIKEIRAGESDFHLPYPLGIEPIISFQYIFPSDYISGDAIDYEMILKKVYSKNKLTGTIVLFLIDVNDASRDITFITNIVQDPLFIPDYYGKMFGFKKDTLMALLYNRKSKFDVIRNETYENGIVVVRNENSFDSLTYVSLQGYLADSCNVHLFDDMKNISYIINKYRFNIHSDEPTILDILENDINKSELYTFNISRFDNDSDAEKFFDEHLSDILGMQISIETEVVGCDLLKKSIYGIVPLKWLYYRDGINLINKVSNDVVFIHEFLVNETNNYVSKVYKDKSMLSASFEEIISYFHVLLTKYKHNLNADTQDRLVKYAYLRVYINIETWCYYNKLKNMADNVRDNIEKSDISFKKNYELGYVCSTNQIPNLYDKKNTAILALYPLTITEQIYQILVNNDIPDVYIDHEIKHIVSDKPTSTLEVNLDMDLSSRRNLEIMDIVSDNAGKYKLIIIPFDKNVCSHFASIGFHVLCVYSSLSYGNMDYLYKLKNKYPKNISLYNTFYKGIDISFIKRILEKVNDETIDIVL